MPAVLYRSLSLPAHRALPEKLGANASLGSSCLLFYFLIFFKVNLNYLLLQTILTQCPWFQTSPNQAVPVGCEQLKSL